MIEKYSELTSMPINWILCSDAFPTLGDPVLTLDKNGSVGTCYLSSETYHWHSFESLSEMRSHNIIAWAWPIVGPVGALQYLYIGDRCYLSGRLDERGKIFREIREAHERAGAKEAQS